MKPLSRDTAATMLIRYVRHTAPSALAIREEEFSFFLSKHRTLRVRMTAVHPRFFSAGAASHGEPGFRPFDYNSGRALRTPARLLFAPQKRFNPRLAGISAEGSLCVHAF